MEPKKTFVIPGNLDDLDAILEPLACILSTGQKMSPVLCGDRIAIVGVGYMGLGTIVLLKAMGYGDIVAIDLRREAL